MLYQSNHATGTDVTALNQKRDREVICTRKIVLMSSQYPARVCIPTKKRYTTSNCSRQIAGENSESLSKSESLSENVPTWKELQSGLTSQEDNSFRKRESVHTYKEFGS